MCSKRSKASKALWLLIQVEHSNALIDLIILSQAIFQVFFASQLNSVMRLFYLWWE